MKAVWLSAARTNSYSTAAASMPTSGTARPRSSWRRRRLKRRNDRAGAPSLSVPEVAHSGEKHGELRFVGSGDHFLVADRAAGLNHGGCAGFGSRQESVGEGEEGVGRDG